MKKRRSQHWTGKLGKQGIFYCLSMKGQDNTDHTSFVWPKFGIRNTSSELTPCNSGGRDLVENTDLDDLPVVPETTLMLRYCGPRDFPVDKDTQLVTRKSQ